MLQIQVFEPFETRKQLFWSSGIVAAVLVSAPAKIWDQKQFLGENKTIFNVRRRTKKCRRIIFNIFPKNLYVGRGGRTPYYGTVGGPTTPLAKYGPKELLNPLFFLFCAKFNQNK